MDVEAHEQAMDYAFRLSDHFHKGDLFDGVSDARSEARYDGPDERERLFAQRWSWDEWDKEREA